MDDVPVVRELPDVFHVELYGVPHERQGEFQIDLNLVSALIAKTPYCLEPLEMLELSTQLQELLNKGVYQVG